MIETLERWRHKVPFWWWLTYDAIVFAVIFLGVSWRDPWFWIGMGTLAVAVVIDVIEFIVKRPSARAKLAQSQNVPFEPQDGATEDTTVEPLYGPLRVVPDQPERTDVSSYWLNRAASALDCAVQCCGTDDHIEIDALESRCDALRDKLKALGN